MRKLLILICLSALWITSCKKKQENILGSIKDKCSEINKKLNDYKLVRVDDLTSASGGVINGYFRDDEVKKMIWEHFTDTCRTFIEDYFDDGMLIYVVRQNYKYNKPITYTEEKAKANNDSVWYDDKKTTLEVDKFYLDKNKLIKWTGSGGSDIPVNAPNFHDQESRLWSQAIILLKQLKEQQ